MAKTKKATATPGKIILWILSIIIWLASVVSLGLLTYEIYSVDILPSKFYTIIGVGFVILLILFLLFIRTRRTKTFIFIFFLPRSEKQTNFMIFNFLLTNF